MWAALFLVSLAPGLVFFALLSLMASDRPVPRWRIARWRRSVFMVYDYG